MALGTQQSMLIHVYRKEKKTTENAEIDHHNDACSPAVSFYSLLEGLASESLDVSVSSASFSILAASSWQVGMSWMSPITCPAVQTCDLIKKINVIRT